MLIRFGNVIAGTTIALAAGVEVFGDITAGTTFSMAAGGIALGNVTAGGTIDLAADAHVYGNAKAQTTVTLAAGSFVTGLLTAPTVATLAVNTCYGSIEANSITNANIGSSVCDITVLPSAPINRFAIAPNVSPVPEPGTYALLLSGLCVMALLYNRRKKL